MNYKPRRSARVAGSVVGAGALLASFASAAPAGAAPSQTGLAHRNVRVCALPLPGEAACHAVLHQLVRTDGRPGPNASSPTGLSPSQLESVYGITPGGSGTIAIVDAYNDPHIASDLDTFDSQYGLPSAKLTVVNQIGGAHLPKTNSGWALEISLDVEWAHAMAPDANILLVEASSSSFTNLMAAEDYAGAHAAWVSNSWGGSEFSGETAYDTNFTDPGVSYFVSSGDSGTPAEYPSASPDVISVGGTSLTFNSDGTVTETGWSSSGGGCSAYETANTAQSTYLSKTTNNTGSCAGGMRATPDVASDADPNSGLSVYDSTSYSGQSGWFTVGGTSAAAPVWAARAADTASALTATTVYGSMVGDYYDVTVGNNGDPAGPGYDLVTGMGTWLGADALSRTSGSSSGGSGGGTTTSVHVASIGPYSGSHHALYIPVTVDDANANPVGGATVSVTISGPVSASGSGTTGSNGTVTFRVNHASAGTYTTTVTDITGTGLSYDSGADHGNPYSASFSG